MCPEKPVVESMRRREVTQSYSYWLRVDRKGLPSNT
jgi:hypothetical protein